MPDRSRDLRGRSRTPPACRRSLRSLLAFRHFNTSARKLLVSLVGMLLYGARGPAEVPVFRCLSTGEQLWSLKGTGTTSHVHQRREGCFSKGTRLASQGSEPPCGTYLPPRMLMPSCLFLPFFLAAGSEQPSSSITSSPCLR